MKEKIDWYQEVLELEPGSKVFFPLARLLAESAHVERAVQILRKGLDRHPEFIEARLFLIDLLFSHGQVEACEQQMQPLVPLFRRYTGFWQAWGKSLVASGQDRDMGLALSFLAAVFQQGELSFSDVLARGLNATLAEPDGVVAAPAEITQVPEDVAAPANQIQATLPPLSGLVPSLPVDPRPEPSMPIYIDSDAEEPEERFSLRTRSMAEILAEQGDFSGALEIYQELIGQATSPEEAADLTYRISTLTSHLGLAQELPHSVDPLPDSLSGRHRVLSVLEALAERLETRAHG